MSDAARPDRMDETVIADRRHQVAQLYLRRVPQVTIASKLKVSPATISADLATLRAEWQQEHKADVNEALVRDLAEMAEMEQDCAVQFANTHEVAWILARLKIKERRARALGYDAPVKSDVTSGGMPLPVLSEIVVELPWIEEEEKPLPQREAEVSDAPLPDADEPVTWPTLREVVVELPE